MLDEKYLSSMSKTECKNLQLELKIHLLVRVWTAWSFKYFLTSEHLAYEDHSTYKDLPKSLNIAIFSVDKLRPNAINNPRLRI